MDWRNIIDFHDGGPIVATKQDLQDWVVKALSALGGSAILVDVAKKVWAVNEAELRRSGDLFYTWQYDMRWAANILRKKGVMKPVALSPSGVWELAGK